ncbi:DEAD-box ATP-dependent RNA helicase 48 [Apostasia shenzhenica]|uniref:ATP-dependent RNA helicase n=1 Tax=Apostasia shenzhenica TaxID=1088818 RepID=A0A2I0AJE8_9ASPA|nr:DEAD-box ATP-dependent RNA helicase 48 [Apostasia shenzhenica]
MSSTSTLRHRCKPLPKVFFNFVLFRTMGGGPRTFPGGLNKWQYKRMHEKLAKEKERRLLQQEKQIYQARLRSEIRSKLAGKSPSGGGTDASSAVSTGTVRMSSTDHIRALADRFMKEGAEDLWNEDDGPVKSRACPRPSPSSYPPPQPLDLKRIVGGKHGFIDSLEHRRKYSRWSRNASSDENDVEDFSPGVGLEEGLLTRIHGRSGIKEKGFMFSRFSVDQEDLDEDLGCKDGGPVRKKMMSGAALENYDVKMNKRRAPRLDIEESYLSEEIRNFRQQMNKRFSEANEKREEVTEESLLTQMRCGNPRIWHCCRHSECATAPIDDDSGLSFGIDSFHAFGLCSASSTAYFVAFGSANYILHHEGDFMASQAKGYHYFVKPAPWSTESSSSPFKMLAFRIWKFFFRMSLGGMEGFLVICNNLLFLYLHNVQGQLWFDECNVSPLTVKALNAAGYVNLTVVQEAALPLCLEGRDVLVKAKTGTGKSAAFLLPAIEAVVNASSNHSVNRGPPILVLIVSPTRELAIQLAAEANVLLKYHVGIGVQTLIGGTRFKLDQKLLESNPCQIIVATPGRLLDHVENKSGFSVRLMGLKMLILDEVDHLLDLGFRKDIEKIVDCIPRDRQSLLFSATIFKEVRRVSQLVLKKDHVYVDTVGLGHVETHDKVVQAYIVAPHELHFYLVHHLLNEHIKTEADYKVIVFCTTAMVTAFTYVLLKDLKLNVREMHSRKPQLYRSRISDEFRESKHIILVTSDVSARGMNYPDVTLVIQVGIPPDREQYIHRLERTGREGNYGKGMLLLAPWEDYFIDEIKDLPIVQWQLPELDPFIKQKVENSIEKVDLSIKEAAYHAWLGYYNSIREIGRDKTNLVELAKRFSQSIGLSSPPKLYRKTALKMGLKGISGISLRK